MLRQIFGNSHCVIAAEDLNVDIVPDLAWEVEEADTSWLRDWGGVSHLDWVFWSELMCDCWWYKRSAFNLPWRGVLKNRVWISGRKATFFVICHDKEDRRHIE